MKKCFLALLVLFLLTGCDIEYNLTVDNDTFSENIDVITPDTDSWKNIVKNSSKIKQISYINNNSKDYYKLNYTKGSNKLNYFYKYNGDSIVYSNAITQCYKYVTINNSRGYIDIKTNPSLACWYRDGVPVIDNLTINIKTSLRVISNNADKVNGNTYTWVINDTNFEDKPIEIKIKKDNTVDNSNVVVLVLILILLAMLCIGYIIYRIIRTRHTQMNKI